MVSGNQSVGRYSPEWLKSAKKGTDVIHEGVVITLSARGTPHITPLGMRSKAGRTVLAPFRPSTTLDNLAATGVASMNFIDDVRVIAGCLTGRREFELVEGPAGFAPRLACALTVEYLSVAEVQEDAVRPRFHCEVVGTETVSPFRGFNRAQAAVLEAAILYSRVGMLPAEKLQRELGFHTIAVEKTAGARETEAWDWLLAAFAERGIVPQPVVDAE